MNRRGLFQALSGLVVAGTASAGSHEPQKKMSFYEPHPCPVCGKPALAAQARKAEVAPEPDANGWPTRCYEIMGVAYMHESGPPCDIPIQKVVPITSEA